MQHHTTAAVDRLPTGQKVAYGLGGVVPIALFNIVGMLMGLVANIGLGISALLIGWIMMIPRLWDAFSDPIMGHISDNTRSRNGRRRPYILWGGIGVCISFVAMWWIPKGDSAGGVPVWIQLLFVLVQLLIFYTMVTVFEIPHGALGLEMSSDYHERTRLFSYKSFIGNVGAMATPWLYALAQLQFFKGAGGNETDGMRPVSVLVALLVLPMILICYRMCRERKFEQARTQQRTTFRSNIRITFRNRTFLALVAIVFLVVMGFNVVGNFSNYITIFYLYSGDKVLASRLMAITGTVWGVTSMVALFPLNWISSRCGKTRTLLISALLMIAAQLSKIFCYNPAYPYLILIPTTLLSAGMVMFFTLGPAMVADICDEEELRTGQRNEGAYYSTFWWFMKTGTAFAWVVAGALLATAKFDDKQSSMLDAVSGPVREIIAADNRSAADTYLQETADATTKLRIHFEQRQALDGIDSGHYSSLLKNIQHLESDLSTLATRTAEASEAEYKAILKQTHSIARQSPVTLYRLRLFEIGLPVLLCIAGIAALRFYPLSEQRAYEIKAELDRRKEATT